MIEVLDNGVGIDPAELRDGVRAIQETERSLYPGAGLGPGHGTDDYGAAWAGGFGWNRPRSEPGVVVELPAGG